MALDCAVLFVLRAARKSRWDLTEARESIEHRSGSSSTDGPHTENAHDVKLRKQNDSTDSCLLSEYLW